VLLGHAVYTFWLTFLSQFFGGNDHILLIGKRVQV